jgi:recombination protein RecT
MKTEANGRMIQKTDSKPRELTKVDTMVNYIESLKSEMARALPKHLTADRMTRIAVTALRTTKNLADCTVPSFVASIMACSVLGIEPNTPLGEAFLIPFWNKKINEKRGGYECQLIIGYQGYRSLAFRSGQIASMPAYAVFKGDHFEYELGLSPSLKHKPSDDPNREDPANLTHVYCVIRPKDATSEPIFLVLSRAQVEKRRTRGASGKTYQDGNPISTPWDTDYEAMALKTVVRAIFKWAPRSTEMVVAGDIDDRIERGASILPSLPESVASAMLAGGAATDRDTREQDDAESDEQRAEEQQKPAAAAQKPPNTPANTKPGHIFPSEIKDIKKQAQDEGNEGLAEICERALTGDADAKAAVITIRDAKPQREIE